jgi:hypothetical protein
MVKKNCTDHQLKLVEVIKLLENSLTPQQFYTKKAIYLGLKSQKLNVVYKTVGTALQQLKKRKFISYNSGSKFWTVNESVFNKISKAKELIEEKDKMLSSPELYMVQTFQKVVDIMVKDAIKHNVQTSYHDLIIESVKEKCAEEFKLEVKPAIVRLIADKVEAVEAEKMEKMQKYMKSTVSSNKQIRFLFTKFRAVEKVLQGFGLLTKPFMKSGE